MCVRTRRGYWSEQSETHGIQRVREKEEEEEEVGSSDSMTCCGLAAAISTLREHGEHIVACRFGKIYFIRSDVLSLSFIVFALHLYMLRYNKVTSIFLSHYPQCSQRI